MPIIIPNFMIYHSTIPLAPRPPLNAFARKISELTEDVIKYNFCPICTNTLTQNISYHDYLFNQAYCNDCLFYVNKTCFRFIINNIGYTFNPYGISEYHPHETNMLVLSVQKPSNIEYKDIIYDVDSLTLIKLYNNLKKYIVFQ